MEAVWLSEAGDGAQVVEGFPGALGLTPAQHRLGMVVPTRQPSSWTGLILLVL